MSNKPDWKDAPSWANELWVSGPIFCWSDGKNRGDIAIYDCEKMDEAELFEIWPECWTHIEERP